MSVLEHSRAGKPQGYHSANQSKWEYSNSLYQKHLEMYLDRMYHHLRNSGATNVLDAGCGEGIVYRAMRERGYRGAWTGFDFSADAVAFARRASPEAVWQHASAYAIPFTDHSFDLVFSSQVLEHLTNPAAPLAEMLRVSAEWVLLSVPLEPCFRALTWFSVHLHLGGDPGHVNHWTGRGFRKFCREQPSGQALETWELTTVYQIALLRKVEANPSVGALQQRG